VFDDIRRLSTVFTGSIPQEVEDLADFIHAEDDHAEDDLFQKGLQHVDYDRGNNVSAFEARSFRDDVPAHSVAGCEVIAVRVIRLLFFIARHHLSQYHGTSWSF